MAISTTQYIDLLFKKLNGVAKTATAIQKSPSNESIASPPLLRGDIIWMQSGQIPATAQVVADITQGYLTTSRIECVPDTTVPTIGGIYPTWLTNLTNWVPQEFGSTWPVKIYVDTAGAANPAATGTQIFSPGIGGAGEFFFDTQAGLLNFIGETIPSTLTAGKSIFVIGYRYVGLLGVTNLPSANIGNIQITGNTIVTLNTDGDLVLDPNGTGQVIISSNLTVVGTIYGNISGNISGNVTVPGANGDVIFNTANVPNASSALNFNYTSNILSVAGNIIGSNVSTSGLVFATGNITGGNLNTANLVSATTASITGNIQAGNVNVANIIAALGNVSGSNVVTGGNVTAIGNVITAGVETTQLSGNSVTITATGLNQGISLAPNGVGNINVNSRYINNLLDPLQDQDAATKVYVDSVAQGLDIKASVNLATTATLGAYTYNNGASGVGATITGSSVGVLTVDGEAVTLNARVLVKNEPSAGGVNAYNGIYLCTTAGDAGTAYVLTRSTDFNQPAEMYSAFTFVEYGTVNSDTGWVCTNNSSVTIVVGTTPIVFTQFSGAGAFTAGNGLSTTGTQFNVNVDPETTTINGSNQVAVKASANLTTPNIGAATGSSLSVTGNIDVVNVNATGYVSATGNVIGGNINTAGLISVTGNVNSGNVNTGSISLTGNVISDLAVTGNVTAATVVSVGNMSGANIATAGLITAIGNIIGGNIITLANVDSGNVNTGFASVSGNVNSGNVNTAIVSASGNITGGNIITLANVDSGNVNTGFASVTGNVNSGNVNTTLVQATTVSATANIIGGNIATLGIANVATLEVTGNANVVGNIASGNINTGGIVSAAGNIIANPSSFFIGNGSQLTGIDATSIQNGNSNVKVYANANVATSVNGIANILLVTSTGVTVTGTTSVTGNVTVGNVSTSGTANIATLEVTGTTSVAGNTTSGNLLSAGLVSATGNVTGGNILTGGLISSIGNIDSTANIAGGNIITNGLISATGNITGGNIITLANVDSGNVNTGFANVTGNVNSGNVNTTLVQATTVSATANVIGGNITTAGIANIGTLEVTATASIVGNITTTANISGGFILGNGAFLTGIDATSIQNGNSNVRVIANGNITVGVAGTSNVVVFANTGVYVTGVNSTTGNITGGNIITVANVDSGNVNTGFANVSGNVNSGNVNTTLIQASTVSITGNVIAANVNSTSALTVASGSNGNILISADGTGIVKITGGAGFVVPVGNTAQRPSPVDDGTLRLNSTLNELEVYAAGSWQTVGSSAGNITVTDQQITPDGTNTVYTLDQVATAPSIMVAINGVTQTPNDGYTVTGNLITFVEAPLSSDYVDVRFLTSAVASPGVIYNSYANSSVQVNDVPEIAFTVNNTVRTKITANGIVDISTGRSIKMPLYTVSQADALTGRTEGEMIYVQNGDSGAACLAVFTGGAWKRVVLGAAISG